MVLVPRSSPKVSFGSKGSDSQAEVTPGPGDYGDTTSKAQWSIVFKRTGGNAVFGTSARETSARRTPGPCCYCPRQEATFKRTPMYSCRGRQSDSEWMAHTRVVDSGPGPGAYSEHLAKFADEGPKFSIRPQIPKKTTSEPGPGHYGDGSRGVPVLTARSTSKGFSFGTSARCPSERSRNPGPGQYSATSSVGIGTAGPSYSLTPRRPLPTGKEQVPGPGAHGTGPGIGA
eukprot:TRINITY_DN30414_c0_g2_i1.p1 TRINITY_DN30414_c0_g2~~TRINITY_DN30414_c0_g2_i1.p1  ORF type:complete len:230 (-),score=7.65 TRINITY_DN30414_c0_g2_i1:91-780(-)